SLRLVSVGSPAARSRLTSFGSSVNSFTNLCSQVCEMPSCRAQLRPDGLLRSTHVNHKRTNRRTISDSSSARHGLGERQFSLSRAFLRFFILASSGKSRDS